MRTEPVTSDTLSGAEFFWRYGGLRPTSDTATLPRSEGICPSCGNHRTLYARQSNKLCLDCHPLRAGHPRFDKGRPQRLSIGDYALVTEHEAVYWTDCRPEHDPNVARFEKKMEDGYKAILRRIFEQPPVGPFLLISFAKSNFASSFVVARAQDDVIRVSGAGFKTRKETCFTVNVALARRLHNVAAGIKASDFGNYVRITHSMHRVTPKDLTTLKGVEANFPGLRQLRAELPPPGSGEAIALEALCA